MDEVLISYWPQGREEDKTSEIAHNQSRPIATIRQCRRRFLLSKLSRRGFVATATSAMLAPSWINRAFGTPADPRVAKIVADTVAIDMHNHVYPAGTQQGPQGGDSGPTLSFGEELKLSGLTAICAAFALDRAGNKQPGDARVNFLKWLDAIDAELEQGHVSRALTLKDLRAAHKSGKQAIVQSVEGRALH